MTAAGGANNPLRFFVAGKYASGATTVNTIWLTANGGNTWSRINHYFGEYVYGTQ